MDIQSFRLNKNPYSLNMLVSKIKDIYKSIEDFGSQFESMLETISKEFNINDTL